MYGIQGNNRVTALNMYVGVALGANFVQGSDLVLETCIQVLEIRLP